MRAPLAAAIAAGSVLWAVWVGEVTGRAWPTLLPVIWLILGFGFVVGWWIGDERFGGWTVAGLALFAILGTGFALSRGSGGAGVPLLVGAIPWLMAWPLARAGGRFAEQRRER
ncbi:MAG: hypothetical protein QOH13_2305 [Thermoleophilaceae bacterium]|nr:hypothetical protein [Thermoleophilaceae bacterium]